MCGALLSTPVSAASLSTTTCPGAGCFNIPTGDAGTAGIQITGSFVGTLSFSGTIDNINYTALRAIAISSTTNTIVTSATASGLFSANIAGLSQVRVAFTAYTSGTAVVTIKLSQKYGVTANTGAGSTVTDATISVSDITTNNATTGQHGWLPKLSGTTTTFLRGDGLFRLITLNGTTGSIGGAPLLAGACSSDTAAVSGALNSMNCAATPVTYPGDAIVWKAYVSAPDVVTVKVCAMVDATPTASIYHVGLTPQ